MNIYIGNLPYSVTEKELTDLFAAFGEVKSAKVITDKMTGNSKGFGFVEMSNDEEAAAALQAVDGKEIEGRRIRATQARSESGGPRMGAPRSDFRPRSGGQGGHSGGPRRSFNNNRGGGRFGSMS